MTMDRDSVNVSFKREIIPLLISSILKGTRFADPFQFSKIIFFSFLQKKNSVFFSIFPILDVRCVSDYLM